MGTGSSIIAMLGGAMGRHTELEDEKRKEAMANRRLLMDSLLEQGNKNWDIWGPEERTRFTTNVAQIAGVKDPNIINSMVGIARQVYPVVSERVRAQRVEQPAAPSAIQPRVSSAGVPAGTQAPMESGGVQIPQQALAPMPEPPVPQAGPITTNYGTAVEARQAMQMKLAQQKAAEIDQLDLPPEYKAIAKAQSLGIPGLPAMYGADVRARTTLTKTELDNIARMEREGWKFKYGWESVDGEVHRVGEAPSGLRFDFTANRVLNAGGISAAGGGEWPLPTTTPRISLPGIPPPPSRAVKEAPYEKPRFMMTTDESGAVNIFDAQKALGGGWRARIEGAGKAWHPGMANVPLSDEGAEDAARFVIAFGSNELSKVPQASREKVRRIIINSGQVPLNAKQQDSLKSSYDLKNVITKSYEMAKPLIRGEGPGARITGLVQKGEAALGMLPEAKTLIDNNKSTKSLYARLRGRDVGNLALYEQEMAAAAQYRPGMTKRELELMHALNLWLIKKAQQNVGRYARGVLQGKTDEELDREMLEDKEKDPSPLQAGSQSGNADSDRFHSKFSVTAPNGKTYNFTSQEAADKFRKEISGGK